MSTPTLPKTYTAVVVEQVNGPFVFREFPLEAPKDGQVLVKVLVCGVCHSDSMAYEGKHGSLPRILGHEIVGDVAAIPSTEKKWKIGDRVGGAWHGGHDGTCQSCVKGYNQMCENQKVNGMTKDGGYAEYCIMNTEAVVRMPSHINPAEAAPLLCAGVTVFRGMKQMAIPHGEIVAVQGLGGLGHLAIQYSRKMGYRTVALSSSGSKRDFAMQLGANDYVDASSEDPVGALNKMGGASLVVATVPNIAVIEPLINGLGPNGKLLLLAPVGDITVSARALISRGRAIYGWSTGNPHDCEDAIKFAETMGVKCLVQPFPLREVQKAYEEMMANRVRFRAVLTMT